jgi:hypothetical protein
MAMTIERFERSTSFLIILMLVFVSTILMLRSSSAELGWDEAEYAPSVNHGWKYLWSHYLEADYSRHNHGPLAIYLAKLGNDYLPVSVGSLEDRLRLPVALFGSLAIGLMYWALRYTFKTSRLAAILGSSLLLFSVIRLQDTPIIGPHHPMLFFTLAVMTLGYRWLNTVNLWTAIVLGSVFGFAGLAMTYVIPLAVCWGMSTIVARGTWMQFNWKEFKVSWFVLIMIVAAAIVEIVFWPPSVMKQALRVDFTYYLHYGSQPTLVGNQIFERTPRIAFLYWLGCLDAPILICSIATFSLCIWVTFRGRGVTAKHLYLGTFLFVLFAVALSAHIAGSRNLLQFIGVLCLVIGALFDECFKARPTLLRWIAAAVIVSSVVNLAFLSLDTHRTPDPATDGYKAFVEENRTLLSQTASAIVYGCPDLDFYARESHVKVAWNVAEMPWTALSWPANIPVDTRFWVEPAIYELAGLTPHSVSAGRETVIYWPKAKYALISEVAYRYMPVEQPVRRIIDSTWKVIWWHKTKGSWGLRLYERPDEPTGLMSPASNLSEAAPE